MVQPSSRRRLAALVAAAFSLSLAAATVAPSIAGGASDKKHTKAHGALVKIEKSDKYGRVLVTSSGKTLYLLTADTATTLACNTGCTALWRPLMTKGKPRAGKGVSAKKLGTVKRGSKLQVTYDGHPLYRYVGDTRSGQMNGEGIASYGGTWYVLSASGSAVSHASSGSGSGSGGSGGGYGGGGGSW